MVACNNTYSCVMEYQKCDGDHNCADGEDEMGCPCNEWQFDCGLYNVSYPRCIDKYSVFNGYKDCADGRDEEDFFDCPANHTQYVLI